MRKIILTIIAILYILSILCSCNEASLKEDNLMNTKMQYVEQDYLFIDFDENNNLYSYKEFLENFTGELSPIIDKYNLSKYKSIGDMHYTMIKTDEGWILICFGNDINECSYKLVNFSSNISEYDMNKIIKGDTINDVKNIDPNGDYEFQSHSWSEYPQISYHFIDEYCYMIEYIDNVINTIKKFTL